MAQSTASPEHHGGTAILSIASIVIRSFRLTCGIDILWFGLNFIEAQALIDTTHATLQPLAQRGEVAQQHRFRLLP